MACSRKNTLVENGFKRVKIFQKRRYKNIQKSRRIFLYRLYWKAIIRKTRPSKAPTKAQRRRYQKMKNHSFLKKIIIKLSIALRLSDFGSRRLAFGSRHSAYVSPFSALGSRLSAVGRRRLAVGSRLSALGSRHSALGSRSIALGMNLGLL